MSAESLDDRGLKDRLAARRIVGQVISRHAASDGKLSAAHTALATSEDLYRQLSVWVGRDGSRALLARALAQSKQDHLALKHISFRPGSEQFVDGAADAIKSHGDSTTAKSIEAMMVALLVLLARLVGADMVAKLVEPRRDDAGPANGMEKSR